MGLSPRVAEALIKKPETIRPKQTVPLAINLPDFEETPSIPFPLNAAWLFISPPKTGKSKLSEHFSRAMQKLTGKPLLHLDTENGAHRISGAKLPVVSLSELDRVIDALEGGGSAKYSGYILDTADMLSEWCDGYTCLQLKINAIGEAEYGKDYSMSRSLFMKRMMRLKSLHQTLVLIAHTKTEKRDNASQTRPNFTGALSEMVMGQVDSIGYLSIEKHKGTKRRGEEEVPDYYERSISFAGHEGLCAGSRFEPINGKKLTIPDLKTNEAFEVNLWSPILDAFNLINT